MDKMVLKTQEWLNKTYAGRYGYEKIEEDGQTGWPTIYALRRAMQIELKIEKPSNNFGQGTTEKFEALELNNHTGILKKGDQDNLIYILQGSLWCKGYNPGGFTGYFGEGTEKAIIDLKKDAGLSENELNGIVDVTIMRALLDMMAFKLIRFRGDERVRQIQQDLNKRYHNYFGLNPCDGIYGRETNKALIYALQAEEGMSVDTANGYFGTGTWNLCPTIGLGDERKDFVKIIQYALYCNDKMYVGAFDGVFNQHVKNKVIEFQKFMCLDETGIVDVSTMRSLLTSNGDVDRPALAGDCAQILDNEKAEFIYKNIGYRYIGRYLTGRYTNRQGEKLSKALTKEEIDIIFKAGLKIFPIFEEGGYSASHFNSKNGMDDAYKAFYAANRLGFQSGTVIYFAVDFDAMGHNITRIVEYFEAVNKVFDDIKKLKIFPEFIVGVYATRNVCSILYEKKLSKFSFVADMSTGWSGNLGFPMPKNWSFDQIWEFKNYRLKNGEKFAVDKDAYSGRDEATKEVIPPINSPSMLNPIDCHLEYFRRKWMNGVLSVVPGHEVIRDIEFEFDKTYRYILSPNHRVEITPSTEIKVTDDTNNKSSGVNIYIKNGKVNANIEDEFSEVEFNDLNYKIDEETKKASISFLNEISVKVYNGNIKITQKLLDPFHYEISIICSTDDLEVNENCKTNMTLTMSYIIYNDNNNNDLNFAQLGECVISISAVVAVCVIGYYIGTIGAIGTALYGLYNFLINSCKLLA